MGIGRYLPRSRVDVAVALVGLCLSAAVCWVQPNPLGGPVAGAPWLLVVYPLLLSVPLAWRRHSPLAAFLVIMGAVVLQAVVTGDSTEGLHNMYCAGVGVFAVAAYCERRQATTGLIVAVLAYGVYAFENHDIRGGRQADLWAGSFFGVALVTVWLVGVFVRSRRQERWAAAHAQAVEHAAHEAVTLERARLARELHDVISHNLSVMVVQAAGARAAGSSTPEALEKIESSGRDSLVEMRRLLGVLRRDGEDPSLAPQPGIAAIGELVSQVCAAGVPVDLRIEGDATDVAPAVDLSVYRIVQESLTNVIKHAGRARTSVRVTCSYDEITVHVADDGPGRSATTTIVGHGLIGMRERVAMFNGSFEAGPGADGGFAVHARVPRQTRTP
jgi:signal transduction histidine kinase